MAKFIDSYGQAYEIADNGAFENFVRSFAQKQQNEALLAQLMERMNVLQEQQSKLNREMTALCMDTEEIKKTVGNIDFNIRSGHIAGGNGDEQATQILQDELKAYREDLYRKLMSRYITDTQIYVYEQIARQIHEQNGNADLEGILNIMRQQLRAIGLEARSSQPSAEFDPARMEVSRYPSCPTDDEQLDGYVAKSLVPEFSWIPTAQDVRPERLMLSKEKVILYAYEKPEQQ